MLESDHKINITLQKSNLNFPHSLLLLTVQTFKIANYQTLKLNSYSLNNKMPPKSKITAQRKEGLQRANQSDTSSQLSVISESSNILEGSVSSAASKIPLKESKAAIKDRKIVFWTPVMIWPTGFIKTHQKETIEYRSDQSLHSGKYPHIPAKIQGGIIIDLKTTEIEAQVRKLLEIDQLSSDQKLCDCLESKVADLRKSSDNTAKDTQNQSLLDSVLIKSIPNDLSGRIRDCLVSQRLPSWQKRKRDRKASEKATEIRHLLDATQHQQQFQTIKPRHISHFLKIDTKEVYKIQQQMKAARSQAKKSRKRVIYMDGLLERINKAINCIGLPRLTVNKVHRFLNSLNSEQENQYVPSLSSLRTILREQFKLKFRANHAANIKYNDTEFDQKRVWVSRLLAQFIEQHVLVVSIDESSFKQEGMPRSYWQADSSIIRNMYQQIAQPQPKQLIVNQYQLGIQDKPNSQLSNLNQKESQILDQEDYKFDQDREKKITNNPLSIGLTPLQQRLQDLRLSSGSKYSIPAKTTSITALIGQTQLLQQFQRDDLDLQMPLDQIAEGNSVQPQNDNYDYPQQMAKLQRKKQAVKSQGYSFSLIAAITQQCVIGAQITEGGTDAVVFDNFLHRILHKLRVDSATKSKHIVVLMDNATIHKMPVIYETARKFKANVLLNAQYSPWLNPVEQLFNYIKRCQRQTDMLHRKEDVAPSIQKIIRELNQSKGVEKLWLYSLKAWQETLKYGHFDLG